MDGAVVGTSDTIRLLTDVYRVFEDTPLQTLDNFIAGLVTDYMLLDGGEDYQILSGTEDFN